MLESTRCQGSRRAGRCESRAKRDEVNEKVTKDPRILAFVNPKDGPFDSKRTIFGGFTLLVA